MNRTNVCLIKTQSLRISDNCGLYRSKQNVASLQVELVASYDNLVVKYCFFVMCHNKRANKT